MHNNFTFLKKEVKYSTFTNACIEAEKSMVVSYATTAILSRRALELAIKWVYSFDQDLVVPYQDNLATLIHDHTFKNIIDSNLFPKLRFIQQLGNKAVHSSAPITREQAVLALQNLYEFISWIDYCYSDDLNNAKFNENLLADNEQEKRTRKELNDLYERLGSKDRKLEEIIKENEKLRKQNTEKRIKNKNNRQYLSNEISEFKTRKLYIDLELELNNWRIGDNCLEEVEVTGMPNSSGVGYVDYVLYADNGKPLALIEAKKTSVNARIGQVQAQKYADCLEQQYGVRPVIFYTNGFEYYLWDDTNYPERLVSGIYTKEELEWLLYKRDHRQSLKNPAIKDHITDRPYQKMAINAVCESFMEKNRKSLLVMATGSGKTRTAISLVDVLINKGWVKNILFLADRTALVKQAKKNFKNLLPNLSLCNLLDSKDNPESRMVFSTYPTMMNAIDSVKNKHNEKLFTSGHFDLIIIDESHRSIYKKYQAIFNYFDSMLLGLTATPKSDIDKNTYEIFELENNVPTFAYELSEAINEEYLVPYHTYEVKIKFIEEGIHYDQLSLEEQEEFENTFDDGVTEISGEALNSFLFNNDTIDKVIENLMNKGIKVEGGDKIGKTIIFAKNKLHADFIIERFNKLYPRYKGELAKAVYTGIKYVESTMNDFEEKEKLPQIAVSVDMLDTGIDIPEIVNLVFFKKVRSKTKFWQMIGRGTRLCEDLFGVGLHKEGFRIFDYCGNFEFFRANKNGKETKVSKTLTEKLFNVKVNIIKELQHLNYQTEYYINYSAELIKDIEQEVKSIDETKFNGRMKIKYLHKYNKQESLTSLQDNEVRELEEHIAPLVPPIDGDELAKRFEYLIYTIEYADLKGLNYSLPKQKVIVTAENLAKKGRLEQIRAHKELINEVQTEEFWQNATIAEYEQVREAFRDLIKLIDKDKSGIYYTNFEDEILEIKEGQAIYTVNEMQNYRKKVNVYLKEHSEDLVVYKLRYNKELRETDIKHLEKLLWQDLGTKEDYQKEYGNEPLLKMVSKIVGLEQTAVNEVFSEFLTDENLNSNQMEFVKLIVNYIIKNGSIEKEIINEHPFNKRGNIVELFTGKIDIAKRIIGKVDKLNSRLIIG